MSSPKAVVFDIDGMLSPEVSWLALTRDLGASVDDHAHIYDDYKTGRIGYEESKRQLIEIWHATGNANKVFFQNLFEHWSLNPAAQQVIDGARERYTLCLITGSMDLYAQTIARKLGIKHWYANTTLRWNDQGELVDMDYELRQTERKLEHFAEFCMNQKLKPQDCIVVGDGENDIGLFKLSGKGILVLGDENADDYRRYAWKIATELVELEQILEDI
jgi:phosphoserine phosphatase